MVVQLCEYTKTTELYLKWITFNSIYVYINEVILFFKK
jgi:hypothetical protein